MKTNEDLIDSIRWYLQKDLDPLAANVDVLIVEFDALRAKLAEAEAWIAQQVCDDLQDSECDNCSGRGVVGGGYECPRCDASGVLWVDCGTCRPCKARNV